MGFSPHFHLPLLGPGTPIGDAYAFVKDVAVLLALFAALAFIWRRVVTKPDRVTRSWEGVLILGFIAGLMVTDVLFEGAERLAAGLAAPRLGRLRPGPSARRSSPASILASPRGSARRPSGSTSSSCSCS